MPSRRSRARKRSSSWRRSVETRRHDPGDLAFSAGGKRDLEVEVDVARERGGERADDRVADGAVRNLRDERGDGRQRQRFPADARMRVARGGDVGLEARIRDERDGLAIEIAPVRRLVAVAVVDQHRLGGRDSGRPQHVGRRLARGRFAGFAGAAAAAVSVEDGGRYNPPAPMCASPLAIAAITCAAESASANRSGNFFSAAKLAGEVDVESGEVAVGPGKVERRDPGGRGRSVPAPPPASARAGDR